MIFIAFLWEKWPLPSAVCGYFTVENIKSFSRRVSRRDSSRNLKWVPKKLPQNYQRILRELSKNSKSKWNIHITRCLMETRMKRLSVFKGCTKTETVLPWACTNLNGTYKDFQGKHARHINLLTIVFLDQRPIKVVML